MPSSSTAPPPLSHTMNRNLDEWLENCMRDQGISALSSSLSNNNLYETPIQPTNRQLSQPTINISSYTPTYKPNYVTPNYFNNFLNPNSLQKRLTMLQASMSQDFASLPPGVNMSNSHNDQTQNLNSATMGLGSGVINNGGGASGSVDMNGYADGMNIDQNSYNRRYSDPGMPGLPDDTDTPGEGKDDKTNNTQSAESTKIFKTLLEQIQLLHETNSKIFRNLHENKGKF